jgi:F0F1-type ATP synthase membrane subunit b/b'
MINESFWILVSFIILVSLSYKLIKRNLVKYLDSKIGNIVLDISETNKLYEKVKQNLIQAKLSLDLGEKEMHEMNQRNIEELERSGKEKLEELQDSLIKKQKDFENELLQIKEMTETEIRYRILDSANILATEYLLREAKSNNEEESQVKKRYIENILQSLKIN